MTTATVPSHVPPELVRDFNYFDMRGEPDVHQFFKALHEWPDVFYTPHHGGHWVVSRYEDVEHVLENAVDFSNEHQTIPFPPFKVTLLEHDGALHRDFRNILQPFFTPKSIGNLEKVATDLTASLIDGFIEKGECEFTQDFAMKMPIIIIMNLCEFPKEDTEYLVRIADDIVRSGSAEMEEAAFGRAVEYLSTRIIPQRTANPGNDMISTIIQGKVDGGRSPTDLEILGLCSLLIVGGLDTVASMLGFVTNFLARNPGHRQQLLDNPAMIPSAMEELFRRHGIATVGRVAAHDLTYKGVDIKKGEFILTPTASAGLDERRYPDPMTVDFARVDRKHISFGRGPHQCIGSFLARTEIRVFLNEWLKRIPHFALKDGAEVLMSPGKGNRITNLPLVWPVS